LYYYYFIPLKKPLVREACVISTGYKQATFYFESS